MNGEYEDNEIPKWLKWSFIAINRVGFPVVAFALMWYMCEVSVKANTGAIAANTVILIEVRDALNRSNR